MATTVLHILISANYYNRAGKLGNLKQFDEAIKDVSKAIIINPNKTHYLIIKKQKI